jgi:hypothetical protein
MINQQLVDYIKQQLQAGVDKDVVQKALGDAGWQAPDVDDSMKAAASPAGAVMSSGNFGSSAGMTGSMAGGAGSPALEPAKIDPAAAMGGGSSQSMSSRNKFFSRPATAAVSSTPAAVGVSDDDEDEEHPSTKKFVMSMIVMGLVIVILAGALAFVYFNLNGQLKAAQSGVMQSGGGDQSALQAQVTELTSERDALAAQTAQASAERDMLADELGFFVVPPGTSTSTPVTVIMSGTLTGNASTTFALTTAHNVRVLVANSANTAVAAALTPLANGTTDVQLTGTHLPASANVTVTAVNGEGL